MQRREFLASLGVATAAGAFGGVLLGDEAKTPGVTLSAAPSKWPEEVYRRFSVDIHVPDWNPALLSKFDAAEFVETLARGHVQSYLQYTNSHAGICLWKTAVGKRHAAMKGRDFFGEIVVECRKRAIHPLAYFSLIFDNWSFESHEDWRMHYHDGSVRTDRYGVVCLNSPYRDYVLACIAEICGGYDIDGIFFDMLFWPNVCYCGHCEARFQKEQGQPLPRIVDWFDPVWRSFQASRQRWLLDFAKDCTAAVRKARPGTTVNYQYSTIFNNWTYAVPLELAEACDYVGGDFYGGPTQHSLVCKAYHGLTKRRPFEFHTSRTRMYSDHVTVKPMDEIRTESFVATLHSAALMVVDYINADGTLNRQAHEFLGKLNDERAVFEPFLGGDLLADVAIYFDKESVYNPMENGVDIGKLASPDASQHRDAVLGTARILQEAHIPFGIITNANLNQLSRYRAVLLPGVLELTAAQAEQFRQFVAAGGVLYASGTTSLERRSTGKNTSDSVTSSGHRFLLEDVLGVRFMNWRHSTTYLTPENDDLKKAVWPQDHLIFTGSTMLAEALPGAEVLGRITMPLVDPGLGRNIGSRFAAIHSNPPAFQPEANPAIVMNSFGKGRAIWLAASLESVQEKVNEQILLTLLRRALPGPYRFEVETHPAVEMTLFHQPEKNRLLAGLLNLQRQLPQVPVAAVVRVQAPSGQSVHRIVRLPDQTPVPFTEAKPYVEFRVEPFSTLAMFAVECG